MSGWKPTRWWRVTLIDSDEIWCECGNEKEARDHATRAPSPVKIENLFERIERKWVEQ